MPQKVAAPAGVNAEPDAALLPKEQSIALTRDYRLIQKLRGHRYSVDDMLVGHLAATLTFASARK